MLVESNGALVSLCSLYSSLLFYTTLYYLKLLVSLSSPDITPVDEGARKWVEGSSAPI